MLQVVDFPSPVTPTTTQVNWLSMKDRRGKPLGPDVRYMYLPTLSLITGRTSGTVARTRHTDWRSYRQTLNKDSAEETSGLRAVHDSPLIRTSGAYLSILSKCTVPAPGPVPGTGRTGRWSPVPFVQPVVPVPFVQKECDSIDISRRREPRSPSRPFSSFVKRVYALYKRPQLIRPLCFSGVTSV